MIRAVLALGYMLAAGVLLIRNAGTIAAWAVSLLDPATTGAAQMEAAATAAVAAAIIGAAMIGALIFRQPLATGTRAPLLTAAALPSGVLGVAVILGLASLGGGVPNQPQAGTLIPVGFVLGSLLIILSAASEEVLLRGFLQPILVRAWRAPVGIAVTAAAFAIVHLAGGWSDPISLLNIMLGGIWFGLLAYRTGGLTAPILAHTGYNWAETMLFGASPNPGVSVFGAVMDVELEGAAIWGGSVEGLNASLPLSFFLIVMIGALAWPAFRGKRIEGVLTAR